MFTDSKFIGMHNIFHGVSESKTKEVLCKRVCLVLEASFYVVVAACGGLAVKQPLKIIIKNVC